nr:unnamed protein product [Callosobruchus chinensis]
MAFTSGIRYVDPNLLKVFEERLKRIVVESYEVALVLCNIFDIFNQIFPTAYCLNTGYWPYFSSVIGQCLCVCGRFGLPCRHTKTGNHWIDMRPVPHQSGGPNYEVVIRSVGVNGCRYAFSLITNLQYRRSPGRPARRSPKNSKDAGDIYSQTFPPNPFYHEYYGSYFGEVLSLRNKDPLLANMQAQMYCMASTHIPSSTFLLQFVNVPTFNLPNQMSAYRPSALTCNQKNGSKTRNKGCQTHWKSCCENCSGLRDVASIWEPSCSEILTQSLIDLAASPSQSFVEGGTDDSLELQGSVECDNPLPAIGYDRTIRPHTIPHYPEAVPSNDVSREPRGLPVNNLQGVKRRYETVAAIPITPSMVEALTKSCKEAYSGIRENAAQGKASTSGMSYSTALKTTKPTADQEESDDEWFDRNFPPLKPLISGSYLNEELELLDSIIKEDIDKDRAKK